MICVKQLGDGSVFKCGRIAGHGGPHLTLETLTALGGEQLNVTNKKAAFLTRGLKYQEPASILDTTASDGSVCLP